MALGESFPLIYSFRLIRHLQHEQRQRVFARVMEHLLPGGRFVFDAPNVVVEGPIRRAHPEKFPVYDMLWQRDELVAELESAGFEVEQLDGLMRWHGVQRLVSRLGAGGLAPLATAIVRGLDTLPGSQPLEWTVLCRRPG